MTGERVAFASGELTLDGILDLPEKATLPPPGVVVCHPHPLHGGDMYNDVVATICAALLSSGVATLRFNFRGTGRSTGEHSHGVGERDDVWAALDYLRTRSEVDRGRLGLVGYSFGGGVALNAGLAAGVKALAAVSAPPRLLDFSPMRGFEIPVLLVAGDADQFAPAEDVRRLAIALGPQTSCTIVPGADHFWSGYGEALAEAVRTFFAAALDCPQS